MQGPLHVTGEVLATKKAGAYRHLTITAPGIPQRFRAGNFVALSVDHGRLARRARRPSSTLTATKLPARNRWGMPGAVIVRCR